MALSIVFGTPLVAWSINQCTDTQGNVIFTNMPCSNGYKVEKIIGDVTTPFQENELSTEGYPDNVSREHDIFTFDGFEWQIINTHRFKKIGSENSPQRPRNDYFLVVEAQLKNIDTKPRYYGDFILLKGEHQYEDSVTVSVYAKYQLGYESNSSTRFEPGAKLKTFFGFDVKSNYDFILIIEQRGFNNDRHKIVIH